MLIIEFEKYNKYSDDPEKDEIQIPSVLSYESIYKIIQNSLASIYWAYRIIYF